METQNSGDKIYSLLIEHFGNSKNVATASLDEIERCFAKNKASANLIEEIHSVSKGK